MKEKDEKITVDEFINKLLNKEMTIEKYYNNKQLNEKYLYENYLSNKDQQKKETDCDIVFYF